MRIVKNKRACQSARILPICVKEATTEENQRTFPSENAYLKRAPGTGGSRNRMGLNFPEASSAQPSCLGSSCSGVGVGACC